MTDKTSQLAGLSHPDGPSPHFVGGSQGPVRLRQWELVEKVAEGRFAELYLARPVAKSPGLAASYAIKLLKPEWEGDWRTVAIFRREALAGREVSHPHLVSILAANTKAPPYYLVMPWLTGMNLATRLAHGSGMDAWESLWIARQVADALQALHAAGWMHGDVKPGNIFLSLEGHVTLLDLGFARRTDGREPLTDRAVSGTWQYMAPETFLPASGVDIRSDLYSLGAVWFEMLAGRPPFVGSSAAALSQQHREARPKGLEDVVSRLPSSAGRLLRQMLAKHPLRRPQTAREVIDCLIGAEIATLAHRFPA